jgi:hypothetical protein
MKILKFYLPIFIVLLFLIFTSNASGPGAVQGIDRTGSPVGSGSCHSCHSGGNFGTQVSLALRKDNQIVTQYEPGESYTLRITINTTNNPQRYGFQAVALIEDNNANAGSFGSPPSGTRITNIANRNYFEHSSPRNSNNISIEWTAPVEGTGNVQFYAAGNAVNNNGDPSGDQPDILDLPFTVTEASTTGLFNIERLSVNLRLYPNPTTDQLTLDIAGAKRGQYQIQIIDILGREVLNKSVDLVTSQFVMPLNVSDLDPGQYYLKLTDGVAVASKAFLKR